MGAGQASSSDFAFLEWGVGIGVVSRVNPVVNLLEAMKKRAAGLQGVLPRFPSLLISADALIPQGSFAEAQAQYLRPDPAEVGLLVQVCQMYGLVFVQLLCGASLSLDRKKGRRIT